VRHRLAVWYDDDHTAPWNLALQWIGVEWIALAVLVRRLRVGGESCGQLACVRWDGRNETVRLPATSAGKRRLRSFFRVLERAASQSSLG
jgi:hypothetical protein